MSNLEPIHYLIIAVGGAIAGMMNTLAGYGSIITLSILMDILGLPGTIANGTNRINILTNGVGALMGFHKNGKLDIKAGRPVLITTIVGAILGILVATQISNEQFKVVFKYLIVLLFFTILVNPKRWLRPESVAYDMPLWKTLLIFLPIGFYGGFIQMGMGLIFVAAMVLVAKYNLIESNAVKVLTVVLYTAISLAIFHYNGMVDWQAGALLGVSTFIGGYVTAHVASRYDSATLWAYRLLILIVGIVILHTFGVFAFFL